MAPNAQFPRLEPSEQSPEQSTQSAGEFGGSGGTEHQDPGGMDAFWDSLGVVEVSVFDDVVGSAEAFLRERGYAEGEAGVQRYAFDTLWIWVRPEQYRFLRMDLDSLTEKLASVAGKHSLPRLEVRLTRRV